MNRKITIHVHSVMQMQKVLKALRRENYELEFVFITDFELEVSQDSKSRFDDLLKEG